VQKQKSMQVCHCGCGVVNLQVLALTTRFKITDVACGGFVWYKVTRELAHCSTALINATCSEIAMLSFFLKWA